ncbi:phospholipid carrier-dependent glycosyltransferase [Candidatus Gottesmanbacteria bacterium]|nr:phospholipid carrier-dependent glycosyltransferase [Candidatus Gottesmanbacteria bacterium]
MNGLIRFQKVIIISTIFFLLVIITFFFYLSDLTTYGPTWDELVFHRNYGRTYTNFIRDRDLKPIINDDNASWFPPVAVTIGNIFLENKFLRNIYPVNSDRFHLAAVLFGSITVGTVFLIAYLLFNNLYLAIFSSLILATYPQFITQSHNNVRDIGLTMFYSISILFLLYSIRSKHSIFWMALSGMIVGITTDTKQNGAFLVIIGIVWFLFHFRKLGILRFLSGSLFFIAFFLISFITFWPYMWADTFRHLQLAWHFLTDPGIIAGSTTFYDKVYISMRNIPIYYPWVMLFILTPPVISFLALIGLIVAFASMLKGKKEAAILFLWIFVPLFRFFFPLSSSTFDQIRHFFEVVPSIPILASLTLYTIIKWFKDIVLVKKFITVVTLLIFSYNIYVSLIYRPYGTAYFNFFAGPPSYVNHAFDIEYWGSVYREATKVLNERYGRNVIYYSAGLGSHILVEDGLLGKLTDNYLDNFDYIIFMNKQTWLRNNDYVLWLISNKKPLYTIERGGKVIFYQFAPYKEEYLQQKK